ncbi:MAG: methyltransferase domain-containing protein [Vulcanimicrobiota bacterium]
MGSELELFARAQNWKGYFSRLIRPYLGAEVAEVGAGLGGTTRALLADGKIYGRWLCLEPDQELCRQIQQDIDARRLPAFCQALPATLDILEDSSLDSILYIDVLEHIQEDYEELARAARRLRPGGYLVVLSPAHQSLYSPFDQAIGHFRRYSRQSLVACGPSGCSLVWAGYLDCLGFFLSWANSRLLRQSMPNARQIGFWDRLVVPLSRLLDPFLGYRFGKTVLAVWRKEGS